MKPCACTQPHQRKQIALTGGPGAGKTAVLELVRQNFCEHVRVLPEAASIIFGGGFPRQQHGAAKEAAQRAIFYVQRELEAAATDNPAIILCDRGTVDGAAYWPGTDESFWAALATTKAEQLARYAAVIHMRTPAATSYNHQNPLRIETAAEAMRIDERIARAWDGHPRRFFVESMENFLAKALEALELIRRELPECCRDHMAEERLAR